MNPGTGPEPQSRPPHIQSSKSPVPKLVQAGVPGEPGAQARFTGDHRPLLAAASGPLCRRGANPRSGCTHPTLQTPAVRGPGEGDGRTHTRQAASPGAVTNRPPVCNCGSRGRRLIHSEPKTGVQADPALPPPRAWLQLLSPVASSPPPADAMFTQQMCAQHLPRARAPGAHGGHRQWPHRCSTKEKARGGLPQPLSRPERWLSLGELRVSSSPAS